MQRKLYQIRGGGQNFEEETRTLKQPQYLQRVVAEVLKGNVPDFMKRENFRDIIIKGTVQGREVEAHVRVCTDVISVGSNDKFVRISISGPEAQRLAESLGCVLPTEKLVDILDKEAKKSGTFLKFHAAPEIAQRVTDPQTSRPLSERWNPNRPSGRWIMSPIFSHVQSHMIDEDIMNLPARSEIVMAAVRREALKIASPFMALMQPNEAPIYMGHKKETVYHPHLVGHRLVAFYRPGVTPHKGWLPHDEGYFDYSQAARLVDSNVTLVFTNRNGTKEIVVRSMADIIKDEKNTGIYALFSDYRMDITKMYRSPASAVPVKTTK